jgi:hypothetical protein
MKRWAMVVFVALCACAGSSSKLADNELGGQLARTLQERLTLAGDTLVTFFAQDARMVLRNLVDPDGESTDLDLVGIDQIRTMMTANEAPAGFAMTVRHYERDGSQVTQTGDWSMIGQRGRFTIRWRQLGGEWRIVLYRLDGGL